MRDADGAYRSDAEQATMGQVDREIRHARELLDERRDRDQDAFAKMADDFTRRLVDLNLRLDERQRTGNWQAAFFAVAIGLLSLAVAIFRH